MCLLSSVELAVLASLFTQLGDFSLAGLLAGGIGLMRLGERSDRCRGNTVSPAQKTLSKNPFRQSLVREKRRNLQPIGAEVQGSNHIIIFNP